jgi:hypothetical protein
VVLAASGEGAVVWLESFVNRERDARAFRWDSFGDRKAYFRIPSINMLFLNCLYYPH